MLSLFYSNGTNHLQIQLQFLDLYKHILSSREHFYVGMISLERGEFSFI